MRRREHLVARRERDRAEHGVDGVRRVRDEGEITGLRAHECRQLVSRLVDQPLELANQESRRLSLETRAKLELTSEDVDGSRAEAAVVQIDDVRIELPLRRDRGPRRTSRAKGSTIRRRHGLTVAHPAW